MYNYRRFKRQSKLNKKSGLVNELIMIDHAIDSNGSHKDSSLWNYEVGQALNRNNVPDLFTLAENYPSEADKLVAFARTLDI